MPIFSSGCRLRHAFDGFQQKEELLGVQKHRPNKIEGVYRPGRLRVGAVSLAFPRVSSHPRNEPGPARICRLAMPQS